MSWQPTWQRLLASTLVVFVLLVAVLAWRVQTGEDPALAAAAARKAARQPAVTQDDGQSFDAGQVPQQQLPLPTTGQS